MKECNISKVDGWWSATALKMLFVTDDFLSVFQKLFFGALPKSCVALSSRK